MISVPVNLKNNAHYSIKIGEHNILEIVWREGASLADYGDLLQDMIALSLTLGDQSAPVRVLVDFEKFIHFDTKMESLGVHALKDVPYRKMAGYNIQPEAKPMIDSIMEKMNATTTGVIKEFESREEAVNWLLEI